MIVPMPRRPTSHPPADVAYLRPIVRRLGAEEVHRLVDLVALEAADLEGAEAPPDDRRGPNQAGTDSS
jgi:hypothetical protein